ncbi:MAG: hypothetical protein VKI39_06775 [Synechococcus sp.]|nr:hypothetical protein [Synechococcus sp.]
MELVREQGLDRGPAGELPVLGQPQGPDSGPVGSVGQPPVLVPFPVPAWELPVLG